MSFYLPRELYKTLEQRYEDYSRRCREGGIEPIPFRSWAIIDAEYDIAWAAAKKEYDDLSEHLLSQGGL